MKFILLINVEMPYDLTTEILLFIRLKRLHIHVQHYFSFRLYLVLEQEKEVTHVFIANKHIICTINDVQIDF